MCRKIELLESVHGLNGFAVYIKLLQELYQTNDGELKIEEGKFSTWNTYVVKWKLDATTLETIINDMIELNLFDKNAFENGILTSNGIKCRLEAVDVLRLRNRERKKEFSTSTTRGKVHKVKESKVKERYIGNSKKDKILLDTFTNLVNKYPVVRRQGKKEAFAKFLKSVTEPKDVENIKIALKNYLDSKTVKDGFIFRMSKWFDQWPDWLDYKDEEGGHHV